MPPSKEAIREALFNEYNYATFQDVDNSFALTQDFKAGKVKLGLPLGLASLFSKDNWFVYVPESNEGEVHIIFLWENSSQHYYVYRFFPKRGYYVLSKRKRWVSNSKKFQFPKETLELEPEKEAL